MLTSMNFVDFQSASVYGVVKLVVKRLNILWHRPFQTVNSIVKVMPCIRPLLENTIEYLSSRDKIKCFHYEPGQLRR